MYRYDSSGVLVNTIRVDRDGTQRHFSSKSKDEIDSSVFDSNHFARVVQNPKSKSKYIYECDELGKLKYVYLNNDGKKVARYMYSYSEQGLLLDKHLIQSPNMFGFIHYSIKRKWEYYPDGNLQRIISFRSPRKEVLEFDKKGRKIKKETIYDFSLDDHQDFTQRVEIEYSKEDCKGNWTERKTVNTNEGFRFTPDQRKFSSVTTRKIVYYD